MACLLHNQNARYLIKLELPLMLGGDRLEMVKSFNYLETTDYS